MRQKTRVAIIFLTGIFVLYGCTAGRVNLISSGVVSIERMPAKDVYISSAYVFQEEDQIIIYGEVNNRSPFGVIIRGHVDITILDADKKIIKQVSALVIPHSSVREKRIRQPSTFMVWVRIIPPEGAVVRIEYRD